MCFGCVGNELDKVAAIESSGGTPGIFEREDGTFVCRNHHLEECDICCMTCSPQNEITRQTKRLGRPLTAIEKDAIFKADMPVKPMKDVCALDNLTICPRSAGKCKKCPCGEVEYCTIGKSFSPPLLSYCLCTTSVFLF